MGEPWGVLSTQDSKPAPRNRPPKNEAVSSPKFPARLCKSLLRTRAVVNEPIRINLPKPAFPIYLVPSLVGIYNPFQEEFCYQSFCIKPLWAELYNKPFYCSVVGSAVVA